MLISTASQAEAGFGSLGYYEFDIANEKGYIRAK